MKIEGVVGGKNHVIVTKDGRRVPTSRFTAWARRTTAELRRQWLEMGRYSPISGPLSVEIHYCPADRRRRDISAVIDAIWHVLEKAHIVSDDYQLAAQPGTKLIISIGRPMARGCTTIRLTPEGAMP